MGLLTQDWWLVAATFFTGLITAVTGAGGGSLLLGLMALALPVTAVIPIHGLVQGAQNSWRLSMLWEYVDWRFVGVAAVGSLVGAMLIGPVAVNVSPFWGHVVLGGGLLYLVWMPKMKMPDFPGKTLLMGMVVSMVSMVMGAAGTLFNAIRRRGGRSKEGVLADQSAIMLFQHAIKVVVFGLFGFAYGPYLPLVAGMMVAGLLGTYVGVKVMKRMTNEWFDLAFKGLVSVLALKLLYDALAL
ncbi:MAG: TSUP family transporter [Proteobacteria bacterium]|nr:TSUP family transporter [Pseudomonadota bacterium]